MVFAQGGSAPDDKPKIDYSSKNSAGILYYDIDETVDFVKIKDEETDRAVARALKSYNNKIKKIEFLNTENFEELDEMINGLLNAKPSRNKPAQRPEGKEHLKGLIGKVKKEITAEEEALNKQMLDILDDKQNKKWLKYQKKMQKTLLPERPSSPSQNAGPPSSFGGGNGLQRGRRF